ncbi:unnamed protein product [Mytilus coruscus]|uniref:Uncharacterized protein n=1 Tax=Mytilus coruscus TaxID=42192 RepID=A0A6J8DX54_MYTCO|nr:unnamed protein product [Mytilus coruscus]
MDADSDLEEYSTNDMYILPGDELKLENQSEEDSRESSFCLNTVCDEIFACYICSQILPWARVSSRNMRPFLKGQTYICNYCDKKSSESSHKPKSLLDDRDNESLKAAIIQSINNQGISFDTVYQSGIIHPPCGTSILTSHPGDVTHQNLEDFHPSISANKSNLFQVHSEERVSELSTLKLGQISNQFVERKLENELRENYTKLQTDAQVIDVKGNAEKDLVKKYQNLTEEMLKQGERHNVHCGFNIRFREWEDGMPEALVNGEDGMPEALVNREGDRMLEALVNGEDGMPEVLVNGEECG